MIDRAAFFAAVRSSLFGGRLKQGQVDGLNVILEEAEKRLTDPRQIAYVLATAYHETGRTIQPVRETFATSDASAIARLDKAFRDGKLGQVKTPYWREGWFGRGYVQLTHRDNYAKMSAVVGVDLVSDPGRAMEPRIAALILVEGMKRGSFTGKGLDLYFPAGGNPKWQDARRIVNGTDRAATIADYARKFHAALTASERPDFTDPPFLPPELPDHGNTPEPSHVEVWEPGIVAVLRRLFAAIGAWFRGLRAGK